MDSLNVSCYFISKQKQLLVVNDELHLLIPLGYMIMRDLDKMRGKVQPK